MKRITYPLKPQMKRSGVGDLQAALQLLGYAITEAERSAGRYGAATRDMVCKLQTEHRLSATGVVDEATAGLLNRLLGERGVLDADVTYQVKGVVRTADGAAASGVTVRAFDRDGNRETPLGAATTGADGGYRIGFGEERFKSTGAERGGPEVFIRVADKTGKQLGQSKTVKDAPPDLVLDFILSEYPITKLVVHGTVVTSDGKAASNVLIKVFDRNVGIDDAVLGQADLDARGQYIVTYARGQLLGKPTADLVIGVYAKGENTLLYTSDVIFNASADVVHDVELSAGAMPEASVAAEFESLSERIAALRRVPSRLGELKDKDITFLSRKTQIDTVKLRWLVDSDRLADGDSTLARFYYALLADGQATEPVAILARDRASIARTLESATAAHLIAEIGKTDLERILDEELPKRRGRDLLKPAPPTRPASLGDLLDTLPEVNRLGKDEQLAFAIRYGQHGNTAALWQAAQADAYSAKIPALQRTLALAEVTQGHGALVRVLQQDHDPHNPGSIAYLAKLARRDWLELALANGAPAECAQSAVEYGFALERIVERRFPMAALRERLVSGEITIRNFPTESVVKLLSEHPDFDPANERVDAFLERVGARTDELSKALRGFQRVLPLAGALRPTAALLKAGLDSALAVSRVSPKALAACLGNEGNDAEAQAIYNRCLDVTMTNTALVSRYSPLYNRHAIPAIQYSKTSTAFLNKYPNLRALFGDLDYCSCRHCQSILGPAAYLTDLLNFLKSNGRRWEAGNDLPAALSRAFVGLGSRRPDLASLLLTCENTNIEIPYIDLVLEVLENRIALPAIETVATDRSAEIVAALDNNEVPMEIRDVLAKTAITIGNELEVSALDETALWDLLTLVPGRPDLLPSFVNSTGLPIKLVRIDDGARRWIAGYLPKLLWSRDGPNSIDVDAVEKDLKQGRAPAEIVQAFERHFGVSATASVTPLEVPEGMSPIPISVACELTLSVGVDLVLPRVVVAQLKPIVTLLRPDGGALRKVHVDRSSLEMIEKWLKGQLTGEIYRVAVMSLLQLPVLSWDVSWDEASRHWRLRCEVLKTPLYITESILLVYSLTYRCSSIQTDLAAVPENCNPLAYEALRNAKFPWTLPLDLWIEEVRVYLQELGVPRQRLMEIAGLPLDSLAYSCEVLGLSVADVDVIGDYEQAAWQQWGLPEHVWPSALKRVSMILKQSGLSFRELLDIRQTGPDSLAWPPITPAGECHPDKMWWGNPDQDCAEEPFAWIHAFTHLWRKTGWTMRELNQVLRAMPSNGSELSSDEVLCALALMARLRTGLNQPILQVVAMLGHIELTPWVDHLTEGEPVSASLYERVFQCTALRPSASFGSFALDSQRKELRYLSAESPLKVQSLSEHAPFLAAALSVAALDIELIIEHLAESLVGPTRGLSLFTDELRLSNLTTLTGAAACCRTLGLGADDFIRWARHLGHPFKSASLIARAKDLLAFADGISFARRCGTSLDELDYLLRHDPQGGFIDTETRLRSALAELCDALRNGALLGDISPQNVCAQLAKLKANDEFLAAIRDQGAVTAVLNAEVVIEPPLSGALPDLPAELVTVFDYRRKEDGTVWLGCRGIVGDDDFNRLPQDLDQNSIKILQIRYRLVRDVLASQLLFLCTSEDAATGPSFPTLIAGAAVGDSAPAVPECLQSFLSIAADSERKLKLLGLITEQQAEQLKEMLPGLEAQFDDLARQSENVRNNGVKLLEAPTADDLLMAKSGDLLRLVMQQLVPVLEADLLTSKLAGLLAIEPAVIGRLLNIITLIEKDGASSTALALLTNPDLLGSETAKPFGQGQFDSQIRVLFKLDKAARLVGSLHLTGKQLDGIGDGAFDALRLNDLPTGTEPNLTFDAWRSLRDLVRFRDCVAGGDETVEELAVSLREKPVAPAKLEAALAKAYGLNPDQAGQAADRLGIRNEALLRRPAHLLRWIELLNLLKLLGTRVETIGQLVSDAPTAADAMAARKLFMAQFDAETLPKRLQPVSDKLRVRQRDALIAYLAYRDQLPDENALLDYYLIDAKMEPCMRTSRIKQAISSVQLYIQRCLLNLESQASVPVAPSDIDTTQWRWMKNYRVWEANRKVFLYPENWIEPDLRDDKTEIFRAFESDLQQEDLDGEMALDAFRGYLERAVDIARLRVIAVWREGNVVQILARDSAAQAKHYHRQLTFVGSTLAWTAWESIEGSADSEHVFIFKLAGFLHVAYAEVKADAKDWKVGFVVRRKTKKGWSSPHKISERDNFILPMIPNKNPANTFVFTLNARQEEEGKTLDIYCHTIDYEGSYISVPREGELEITAPYETGVAQQLHASIRVLEKFSDQYGHSFFAKPSAREWVCNIESSILISIPPLEESTFEVHTVQRCIDTFSASDTCSLLEYFGLKLLASAIRIHKVIVTVLGDPGIHEEHAISLEIDVHDMGKGSYERDIVFSIKNDLHHPAFLPERSVSYHPVGKKFVINEYLSIGAVTASPSPSDALPELPDNNSERYRSGFGQLWTIAEAEAEAAAARAAANSAANAAKEESDAAENAKALARAANDRVDIAKKQQDKAEAKAKELKEAAEYVANKAKEHGLFALLADIFTSLIGLGPIGASVVAGAGATTLGAAAAALEVAHQIAEGEATAAADVADEAERAAKKADAEAKVPVGKADEAAGLAAWLDAEAKVKEANAKLAAAFTSIGDYPTNSFYLTHSTGRYFRPSTQPRPRTWSVSDAYCDDRFQLYFLWHEGKQRILADGPAWLYAGLRQLPSPIDPGSSVALLPDSFQTLSVGKSAPSPDPLAIPLAFPLGKDSPKDLRVSFSSEQPSSIYDWEAVFHAPLLIATQLSSVQRFEDAQRWFHTIFDPTTNDPEPDESKRYWRFPKFREAGRGEGIDQLLEKLAQDAPETVEDRTKLEALRAEITAWKSDPFKPHLIARYRIRAYQWAVVMKYIENLIAWGDQLFRRETIEAINEATQLYILAARILGRRPASIPRCQAQPRTFMELAYGSAKGLDEISNAWVALEDLGFEHSSMVAIHSEIKPSGLYFCVPQNSAIEELWDTVENRLFYIRHCRNIDGVERKLPLFEPPIDPALLVKAAVAGLDISTVLADLTAPLPWHRFMVMLSKALETCADLRALGSAVLQAFEKKDAEDLALLRNSHESALLKLTEQVKQRQIDEAMLTMQGLEESRRTAEVRYDLYQRLLGRAEVPAPKRGEVAALAPALTALATSGPEGIPQGLGISQKEAGQLQLLRAAQLTAFASGVSSTTAGVLHAIGGILSALPRGSSPGPLLGDMGGPLTGAGHAANAIAGYLNTLSGLAMSQAGIEGIVAGYERRRDDWIFQGNMALREMAQVDKQWAAADIRKEIAEKELDNTRKQIDNARTIDEFMKSKYSSAELYRYMSKALLSLYFRTYQLALDVAKRAQRCFQFEVGRPDASFIEPGYWDSARKGLLSGEQLHLDLRRMELAYMESLKRDYEITKHVSLLQIEPLALIALRQNGRCEFTVPEAFYDLDCPGHYLRRIKSVNITIPCVTGPYAGVHCTLTLLSSSVRQDSGGSTYQKSIEIDDPRFRNDYSSIQSIVTSGAQADTGLFETNLRDERYLPFEGAGAISTWRLELPSEFRQFDYKTISDVILHIRYTAREGGSLLRQLAINNLKSLIDTAHAAGSVRLFSVRDEFPTEWAKFQAQEPSTQHRFALELRLRAEHFPFWSKGHLTGEMRVDVVARSRKEPLPQTIEVFDKLDKTDNTANHDTLTKAVAMGNLLIGKFDSIQRPAAPIGDLCTDLKLFFDDKDLGDLLIALTWGNVQTP